MNFFTAPTAAPTGDDTSADKQTAAMLFMILSVGAGTLCVMICLYCLVNWCRKDCCTDSQSNNRHDSDSRVREPIARGIGTEGLYTP